MSVKLRLTRAGSKKKPFYRIVAADSRMPRDGRFIEIVGRYNPRNEPSLIELNKDKALKWLSQGAQPTNTVEKLLNITGIREEFENSKSK
ncbi:30S ribosomal protein S16 [Candidatus Oleimmundimicrobium sp.]|uniref:30S ribosomal protein S16 n=1 Tax=Candidatus Oleimmundimicrobium sp. TaxID=3060597 RepID=UPI0027226DA9|nr:30S ribosomal protein S16 [Candidatus Oleimmundimicrobium sp.]MDO8885362.1 30S ribosomal protein S16 [Candidatus Oleimmundimicrobium sp.]